LPATGWCAPGPKRSRRRGPRVRIDHDAAGEFGGMTSILPTGGSAAGGHLDGIRTALGSDRAIGAKCALGWSFSGRSVEGRAARGDHRRGRGAGGGRASSPEPRRAGPLAGSSRGTRPRSRASGCRPLRQQRPIRATRGSARRCGCRVAARGLSSFHVGPIAIGRGGTWASDSCGLTMTI
jgi:hypothetical protein